MRKIFKIFYFAFLIITACNSQSLNILASHSEVTRIKDKHAVISDPSIDNYLNLLISKLSNSEFSNNSEVKIRILRSNQAIALAAPTGELLFSSYLLLNLNSESQLAFLVAHELAHLQAGHVFSASDPATAFSVMREQELEADKIAMRTIIKADYDPRQAMLALAQIYRLKGIDVSSGTHPDFSSRVFALQNEMLRSGWTYSSNFAERNFKLFQARLNQISHKG